MNFYIFIHKSNAGSIPLRQSMRIFVSTHMVGGKLWGQPALLNRADGFYRDVVLFCHTVKPFL